MAAVSALYGRRNPEQVPLYRVVQAHWRTFVDVTEQEGNGLPKHVRGEFESYLECGIWGRGFIRARCADCGFDRLVAFCCKGRAWCPTCVGRTMNATAAMLVDHVIGKVPVRHWVLTLPPPLRYLCAYDKQVCGEVVNAFVSSISSFLRHQAKRELGLHSVGQAHPGTTTAIQRASSHLALNPHLHTIATEGVWVCESAESEPVFRALPAPTRAEVRAVAWETCKKTLASLRKRGLWLDIDPSEDRLSQDEPVLAKCYAASLHGDRILGRWCLSLMLSLSSTLT